jgi:hypothetical protein
MLVLACRFHHKDPGTLRANPVAALVKAADIRRRLYRAQKAAD